ncbi:aminotransferase class III-fold pyridoxal phosphate-dependent enzyme [Frankia sp. CiP3]|uniref:aminotransferase class III-fold pyridoxal phosphate-dependent enzyme n=1 Tax=Frankia sp. CiP3 TaxID=2880971 RepID=UPI001EF508A8|nr:aminotransferase class III-fold pyridoxal phosphate-dependent enzyme [Frankia sp. CiP3]
MIVYEAEGCYLDTDRGELLDACSGAVNVNVGHRHPQVLRALHEQYDQAHFTSRGRFTSGAARMLEQRLTQMSGGALTEHLLSNSGSEAIEQALRVAWRYHVARGDTGRRIVLSEGISYHGMTAGALHISGHPPRQLSLGPANRSWSYSAFVPTPPEVGMRATASAWAEQIRRFGPSLAAVVIEPVGGASNGAAPQDDETLRTIQAAANEAGALVIADEVMTGFGRTGNWLASQAAGMNPDIIVASKGLGAGYFPVAACMVSDMVAHALRHKADLGTFGHTMGGNPVACAVALAVLDIVQHAHLVTAATENGLRLAHLLQQACAGRRNVGPARGCGMLHAIAIEGDDQNWRQATDALIDIALQEGIVLYPAGVDARTASVLIAPPLTSGPKVLTDLRQRLQRSLDRFDIEFNATTDTSTNTDIMTVRRSTR